MSTIREECGYKAVVGCAVLLLAIINVRKAEAARDPEECRYAQKYCAEGSSLCSKYQSRFMADETYCPRVNSAQGSADEPENCEFARKACVEGSALCGKYLAKFNSEGTYCQGVNSPEAGRPRTTVQHKSATSSNGTTANRSMDEQSANIQSRIEELREEAEANAQAAENFDQQAQMGGAAGSTARMLATQKRQEAQRINRQIAELQSQVSATTNASPTETAPDNATNSAAAGALRNTEPIPKACLSAETAKDNPLCAAFGIRPSTQAPVKDSSQCGIGADGYGVCK